MRIMDKTLKMPYETDRKRKNVLLSTDIIILEFMFAASSVTLAPNQTMK